MSFRDDDEFDPAIYSVGGGLPGMLWRALRQQNEQQGTDPGLSPNAAAPAGDDHSQGGLLGRLVASQANENGYRPASGNGGQSPSPPSMSNARQISRGPVTVPPQGGIAVGPFDEFNPDIYTGAQGAALDWLRASQAQQNRYRPAPTDGVDFDALTPLITGHELGNRPPNTKNPKSSATGPGQFTDDAWAEIIKKHQPNIFAQYPEVDGKPNPQLLALRSNLVLANDMTKALAQDNAQKLRNAGLPVTFGNIYLSHFAGFGGARKILRADPSASAESVLGTEVTDANPFLKQMTAGDVQTWADRQIEVQARRMRAENAAAFQRAYSTPRPPSPTYLQPPAPDFGAVPAQTSPQPVRRLSGRTTDSQSWPLNPAPIASQTGTGLVNDGAGAPGQSVIGLFSGKPMRYWGLPIFNTRR